MKLKQRVVLLAILLVIFIFTKVFLIDNLDTSAANREDQRAFHRMMAGLRVELVPKLDHTLQSPWEIAAQWVVPREVYPEETPELGVDCGPHPRRVLFTRDGRDRGCWTQKVHRDTTCIHNPTHKSTHARLHMLIHKSTHI